MAEFVEKRCEDMISELEQMERIKLFDKNEIRNITKKLKEYEYKIHRHTKCKEDYLRYIQYEMDLLKLVKQRRDKYGINKKKSDIDYTIANKINSLYKEAIFKYQDDIRFWISYMKFCKHVRFHNTVSRLLGRMLQVHQDKPKCWHIAARWQIEEHNDKQSARQFLLRGLHIHPKSQLLYLDAFKLELDDASSDNQNAENKKEETSTSTGDSDASLSLKRSEIIYQQAFERIKDIKFIIELLNVTTKYSNTEKLQNRIVCDMIREYPHEPLMWDTMARRELEGLVQPSTIDAPMDVDDTAQSSLRERITNCNNVYQTVVRKLKTKEIWSLYIECMIEINQDTQTLPNFKRKLLKTALAQAHQAKKLSEKHYLHWISMLSSDSKDENQKKLNEVLCSATDNIPNSVSLWHARLRYLLILDREEEAADAFTKAKQVLGEKALPLWKMKILHMQAKCPDRLEEVFQSALQDHPNISKEIRPIYIEWLVLTKGIHVARKVYNSLCLQPPTCLELHKKMAALEIMQPEISLKHARHVYEMAILQVGKNNIDVWMDYIIFEMNNGEARKVGEIHRSAVKTLEPALTDVFVAKYSLIKAKHDNINIAA